MSPRVSVLLPYRDAAPTLAEAIDSVLTQKLPVPFEVIAVDDGSTDDGPAIASALAGRHRSLRTAATGGAGLVSALSLALAEARGSFIARMDADDVSLPGRLAAQLALLRGATELAVAGTQVELFPAAAIAGGMKRYVDWQNSLLTAQDHARQLFVESPLCHPSVMIDRAALHRVGGWRDGPFPEDYDLWLRLDALGYGLAKVDAVYLRWRHQSGRATFSDPRYGLDRFRDIKAPHLAARVRDLGKPVMVWGAGRTGKRMARSLEPHGVRPDAFIDIDPKKIGGSSRGAPVVSPDAIESDSHTIVVAVSQLGARDQVRDYLNERGLQEGRDYLCVA